MLRFLRPKDKEKTDRAVEKTRKAWFGRVTTMLRGARLDESLWDDLEEILISADTGVATTQVLLGRVRQRVIDEGADHTESVLAFLKDEMVAILAAAEADGAKTDGSEQNPLVLLVVGVNGVGKTTSIAKLTQLYKKEGKKVILGAADTFRAAAIEQLQSWGHRLDADVIAHRPDADPGAVAFDTLQAAKARGADVVIIDTAGRLHTKVNLMEEIKKIQRVLARRKEGRNQRVLLALDATTGQNGLHQAHAFVDALSCDGAILAKLDGTAKGGVVVAIAYELKLPVLYIGTGEQPDDFAAFDPREFVDALFGES